MTISSAGVVGLGTMGAGIVEIFARSGLQVVAVELDEPLLVAGRSRLEASLQRLVDRGRLDTGDRDAALARVRFSTDRAALAETDLVTEAVPERLDVKLGLFADLDEICPPQTILATNTSSLPVTRIAAATGRSERVVGLHFFNPAPVMRLVEVVHTVGSDPEVVAAVRALAERCGKTPVVVADRAGFVANALLFGYLNSAARAAECGHAAMADIDAAMVAACGFPMGPLTLLDLIGLDVSLDVLETMFEETRDQRYAPAPLLRRLVMAGHLGRKSGRGYYRYDGAAPMPTLPDPMPTAEPQRPGRVAAVTGDASSSVLDVLTKAGATGADELAGADAVVIDGGSRAGTAELVARVARHSREGTVLLVATTDEAPLLTLAPDPARAADLVGLHLPLSPRSGVIEVVASRRSSPESVSTAVALVRGADLLPLVCRDRPGHLVDALLLPHLGDAVRMVDDGYASAADVDTAMTLGCGYPDGPFAMLAAVGADDLRSRLLHLAAATHLPALAPAPLLDELAAMSGS